MNPFDIIFEIGKTVEDPITRMGQTLVVIKAGLTGSYRDFGLSLSVRGMSPEDNQATRRIVYDAANNNFVVPEEQQFLRITHKLRHGVWARLSSEEKAANTYLISKVFSAGGGTEVHTLELQPAAVESAVTYEVSLSSYSSMDTE